MKTELDIVKYIFAVEQGYVEERIHYPDNTQVGKGKKKRSKALIFLKDYQDMKMC